MKRLLRLSALCLLLLPARCGRVYESPKDCSCYVDAAGRTVCNSACPVGVKRF